MPCSIEIGGRLPDRLVSDLARAIEADGANDDWFRELPDDYEKLVRDGAILDLFNNDTDEMPALEEFCVKHDLIFRRHTGQPCWLPPAERPPDLEDIFTPYKFDPPGNLRARAWMRSAPKLAVDAARAALANWGGLPSEITHVVTTSTSGWS